MGISVALSSSSVVLLEQYSLLKEGDAIFLNDISVVDSDRLIEWLSGIVRPPIPAPNGVNQEQELFHASLAAALLHDLFLAMKGDPLLLDYGDDEERDESNRGTYVFLSIAGTLFAACEGFDSIATILGVVSASSTIILPIALAFSILSVIAFHAFELVQVAKNLGVNISDASKLLHVYWLQMNEIKAMRQKIDSYCLATLPAEELISLTQTLVMLQKRFQAVKEAGKQFDESLNSQEVQLTKVICSALTGVFFFGGGFCAGQTVGTFFCGLFLSGVTPAFWPVVLISVVVGLAALSLYYYVERVTVSRLVSGWFGLDEDKIEDLCDVSQLEKEEKRLLNLEEKIKSTLALVQRVEVVDEKLTKTSTPEPLPIECTNEQSNTQPGRNIYSFHYSSASPKGSPKHILEAEEDLQMSP